MHLAVAGLCRIFAVLVGGLPLLATPAGAEAVLATPAEIASCLCLEQGLADSGGELQRQKTVYETARARLDRLAAEIERQRPSVNSNDPVSVDSFKELLAQRDAAQSRFATDETPAYSAAVARYNDLVATYNANCQGKAYDPDALARARQNLFCPR